MFHWESLFPSYGWFFYFLFLLFPVFHHSYGGVWDTKTKKYFISRVSEWKHGTGHDNLGAATGKKKKRDLTASR